MLQNEFVCRVSRRPDLILSVADANPMTMKSQAINYDVKDFAPSDCILQFYKNVCARQKTALFNFCSIFVKPLCIL